MASCSKDKNYSTPRRTGRKRPQINYGDATGESSDSDSESENRKFCIDLCAEMESAENTSAGISRESEVLVGDEISMDNLLALNRRYQLAIKQKIQQVEMLLAANREKQQELESELLESGKKKGITMNFSQMGIKKIHAALGAFAYPYFKDVNFLPQPKNEEEIRIQKERENFDPQIKPPRPFTKRETEKLEKAVREDGIRILLRPLESRKEVLEQKLSESEDAREDSNCKLEPGSEAATESVRKKLSETEVEDIIKKIQETDEEILNMRKSDSNPFNIPSDTDYDWMKIAVQIFNGQRTANELKLYWTRYQNPSINKSKWTKGERRKLAEVVKGNSEHNWEKIAKELGTNRTPIQCLSQYQTKINNDSLHNKWSNQEDKLLMKTVKKCKKGNYISWTQVANYMPGRTREQLTRRWTNCLNPGIRKGRWTTEEEALFIFANKRYPENWSRISSFIPGRTAGQIRDKFFTSQNDDVLFGSWTEEEDLALVAMVGIHGSKWAQISKELPGRTDSMCRNRYRKIYQAINTATNMELEKSGGVVTEEHLIEHGRPVYGFFNYEKLKVQKLRIYNFVLRTVKKVIPKSVAAKAKTYDDCVDALTSEELEKLIHHVSKLVQIYDEQMKRIFPIDKRKNLTGRPRLVTQNEIKDALENDQIEEEILKFIMPSFRSGETKIIGRWLSVVNAHVYTEFAELLRAQEEENPEVESIKKMAPLPPTRITLHGFRQLLLHRRQLESQADKGLAQFVFPENEVGEDDASDNSNQVDEAEIDGSRLSSRQKILEMNRIEKESMAKKLLTNEALAYTGRQNAILEASAEKHIPKSVTETLDYQLLQARFLSLFFWPGLMSTVDPQLNDQYIDDEDYALPPKRNNLNKNDESGVKMKKKEYQYRKVKSRKKPWVRERMKKLYEEKVAQGLAKPKEESPPKPTKQKRVTNGGRKKGISNKSWGMPIRRSTRTVVSSDSVPTDKSAETQKIKILPKPKKTKKSPKTQKTKKSPKTRKTKTLPENTMDYVIGSESETVPENMTRFEIYI